MQIRKINEVEIQDLFEISKQQFGEESWTYSEYKSCFFDKNYVFFGFFCDEILVSYAVANESLDDVNILSIATKNDSKKQGYATSLLEFMKNYALKQEKTLSLEVKENNKVAINLYQKLGLKEVLRRKNYYKDGQTAVIMFFTVAKN